MSGAKVMQVGSVLMLKGIEWLPKMIDGVERFLDEHGYADIAAIHGIGSDRAFKTPAQALEMALLYCTIDREKCQYPKCSICIRMCFYDSLFCGEEDVITTPQSCIGCELCYNVCPFDAIRMVPQAERREQAAAE